MTESQASVKRSARFSSPSELSPETMRALLEFGLALADTKYILGFRLSQWTTGAPSLEATVACAALTQEEFGHARTFFSMLRDFPGVPPELNSATDLKRERYYYPRSLGRPCRSWHEVVGLYAVLDGALCQVLRAAGDSEYAPLRHRIPKILQEEHYHRIFSEGWLERLAGVSLRSREALQQAVNQAAQHAVVWFGPADEENFQRLVDDGVFSSSPEEMRRSWLSGLESVLKRMKLSLQWSEPEWVLWNRERRDLEDG